MGNFIDLCLCWLLLYAASTEPLILNFMFEMFLHLDSSFNRDCGRGEPEHSEQ